MALSVIDKRKAKIAALREIAQAMSREGMRAAIERKRGAAAPSGDGPIDPVLGRKKEADLPEDELDVYRGEDVPRGEMRHEDAEELEGDDPDMLAEDIRDDAEKVRRLARGKRSRS